MDFGNATILNEVTVTRGSIGKLSIVAAGTTVIKSILLNSKAGGNMTILIFKGLLKKI